MKFNNKLNMSSYIEIVSEIADNYFSKTTGEYTPQLGNIYSVYVYFRHCVESEANDAVTHDSIITAGDDGENTIVLEELENLFGIEEFMKEYNSAISPVGENKRYSLTFFNARSDAMRIVKNRCANFSPLLFGLTQFFNKFAELFTPEDLANAVSGIVENGKNAMSNLTDEDMDTIKQAISMVAKGKLSADAIAQAYSDTQRFNEVVNGMANQTTEE